MLLTGAGGLPDTVSVTSLEVPGCSPCEALRAAVGLQHSLHPRPLGARESGACGPHLSCQPRGSGVRPRRFASRGRGECRVSGPEAWLGEALVRGAGSGFLFQPITSST